MMITRLHSLKDKEPVTDNKSDMISTMLVIVIFLISFGVMQHDAAAQYTITSCTDCHTMPPTDGTRDGSTGAVVGSHSVAEHLASTCTNCHIDNGTPASSYPQGLAHREGLIEMINNIHGQAGSSYSKGTSFAQSNSPTLGSCSATFCHGTTSATWGTDLSSNDNCTICHGAVTVGADGSAAEYKRAPGADGTGVDTAGQTGTYSGGVSNDPQVGAHRAHIESLNNYSSDIACDQCHTVPATVGEAGHIDNALPAEVNGSWGNIATGSQEGPGTTPNWNGTICSAVYCHNGLYFASETGAGSDPTPDWTDGTYLTGSPSLGGDCAMCHEAPPGSISYHSGVTNINECDDCHNHFNNDGTLNNAALHINGTVEGGECITCHNGVPGTSYVSRDVVGSDFTQSSRHIYGASSITNWDCIVCHREGDATQAASGNVSLTSLHKNSGGYIVDMRNVDSINTGWVWDKNNVTNAMHTDMDTFCMSCHDSDGASGINVKVTDDGVHLDSTRALTPFNSTDEVSAGTGGGTKSLAGYERVRVLDVYTQFDPANPSHHAVRGQAYTGHNANWGDTAWVDRTLKDGTRLITDNIYESARLHCADCHTTDQNAHGGANGFMLQAASIDDTCYLCHNSTTYSDNSSSDTRWDHSNDSGVWDTGKGSKLGQYGANAGSICLNCHGGNPVTDGFGGIHGLPSGSDPRSSQQRYRFQGGSYMSHDPGSWTGTSGSATCYFDSGSTSQDWSSCTKHDAPETGRTSAPQYNRGVPGDY